MCLAIGKGRILFWHDMKLKNTGIKGLVTNKILYHINLLVQLLMVESFLTVSVDKTVNI